ncbi:MAG: carboxypeptidase-like regulatory domain-containing protein, partial [Acidobacteria bacterium]|nr:carboxypeptidase-like regulatory domain-containing protein [Acidobacteriota bacterium]
MTGRLLSGLALGAMLASAQMPSAQITGRITDASGAVIPSTKVTVTNIDTGVSREAAANEQGLYTAALLDPGRYRVSIGKDGFRTLTREGITLHVNDNLRLDFSLEVGSVTDRIDVRAEAPLVQSESAAMGTVVDNTRIVNLPLNSRNPFSLTA